ncbi:uncharacterized protein BcabD6B2_40940 [Babesia caballi]|uniref:Uncharacterized protein n=1 Tax=Babesia caballi TaxID=5871 RepID=A0AAV4LX72_BABCB|nr:hypothetical protein, conserved [Babesia caballi]
MVDPLVASADLPGVLAEAGGVLELAVDGGGLPSHALDELADGHAGGEPVGVEDDVGGDAGLQKGHVLGGPGHGENALLAVPAGELVAHDGIAHDAELDGGAGDLVHDGVLVVVLLDAVGDVVLAADALAGLDAANHSAVPDPQADAGQSVAVERADDLRAEVVGVAEVVLALAGLGVGRHGVDDLGLVDAAVEGAALEGGLVDDHGVLHVEPGVRDHGHDGVHAGRVVVVLHLPELLSGDQGLLREQQAVGLDVGAELLAVVGHAHALLQHLALVHVPRALVVVAEGGQGGGDGEDGRGGDLDVLVFHGDVVEGGLFLERVGGAGAVLGEGSLHGERLGAPPGGGLLQRVVRELHFLLADGNGGPQLGDRADPLDGAVFHAPHGPDDAARVGEDHEAGVLALAVGQSDELVVLLEAELLVALGVLGLVVERARVLDGDAADGDAVDEHGDPAAGAAAQGAELRHGLGSSEVDAVALVPQKGLDGVGGAAAVGVRDGNGELGQVQQQAAGSSIGGVHGADEAPGLAQQLSHLGGPHLGEDAAAVQRPEVAHEPVVVDALGDHGEARALGELEVRVGGVPGGQEVVQLLGDVGGDLVDGVAEEFGSLQQALDESLGVVGPQVHLDHAPLGAPGFVAVDAFAQLHYLGLVDVPDLQKGGVETLLQNAGVDLAGQQQLLEGEGVVVLRLDFAARDLDELLEHVEQRLKLLRVGLGLEQHVVLQQVGAALLVGRPGAHVLLYLGPAGAAEAVQVAVLLEVDVAEERLALGHVEEEPVVVDRQLLVAGGVLEEPLLQLVVAHRGHRGSQQQPEGYEDHGALDDGPEDAALVDRQVENVADGAPVVAAARFRRETSANAPLGSHHDAVVREEHVLGPVVLGLDGQGVVGTQHDKLADDPLVSPYHKVPTGLV